MKSEDFQVLTQVGRALWAEPQACRQATVESLTAVSLLELEADRALERTARALLEKANRDGAEANSAALDHPFYRLIPEERLVLGALHIANWSYARLTRILGMAPEHVTAMAWNARLRLASFSQARKPLYYPTGSKAPGTHCPEYNPMAPWTQKFLDEEMPVRERLFLQNHVMVCESCRKALGTARELYFRVDAMLPIPRSVNGDAALTALAVALERSWSRSYAAARESLPSLKSALERFFSRPGMFPALLFAVGVVTYLCAR